MPHLQSLPALLEALRSVELLREPDDGSRRGKLAGRFGAEFVDASSNDYLGLGRAVPVSRETSDDSQPPPPNPPPHQIGVDPWQVGAERRAVSRETSLPHPLGAGASRLIHGTHQSHLRVESEVASWLGADAALLFSSGYAANVGALAALLDHNDHVVSDRLNHASLIDGIRLSRARTTVAPHLDLDAVEQALRTPCEGARWVVAESYYSMDGTSPDLRRLRDLCDAAGAHLYLDEAHALGVFGPQGAGRAAEAGVRADVTMVAFGKAVGSHGAAVVGSESVRTWLWNRARSFVFSTAPSPAHAAELHTQLVRALAADKPRARLLEASARLRADWLRAGLPLVPGSHGPILGLLVGSPQRALALAERLASEGILVQAIRPPTVPEGQSRLRLTLTAAHDRAALERLRTVVPQIFDEVAE
ncbi:MAG TPA: 8-amino-7-oxononanoate synthase [Polyangiaceae bacterium]|nr:8-amino-7-oxononanoate synthase [Polyangiaceae bacterium]